MICCHWGKTSLKYDKKNLEEVYSMPTLPLQPPLPEIVLVRLNLGGLPTTPDPNASAKASRYKWEAYRDTNWCCIYCFLPGRGHTFAKVSQ